MTDHSRAHARLTTKQAHFCELVAGGMTKTEAYRRSYDASRMKDASVRKEASRLASLPYVAHSIARLQEKDSEVEQAVGRVRTEWIIDSLQVEAADLKNPASTRVRALEILGKINGLFTNQVIIEEQRPAEEIEEELKQKLKQLLGEEITSIDGAPTS